MSALKPETVIQGRVYLIWVKDSSRYADPDTLYGVAFKGNSNFGHQDFAYVCKTKNNKVFYSKCIKEGLEDPTWQECMDAMKVEKAPMGSPKCLTNRAYTFAEIAKIAYEDKYFTDQEGLEHVAKKTAPPRSSKVIKVRQNEKDVDTIEEDTGVGSDDGLDDELNNAVETTETLDIEGWKERAVLAESKVDSVSQENDWLRSKVAELTAKLESSLEHQKKFMITADKATMSLEAMNDDTATKVLKKIDPKLAKIAAMDTSLTSLLTKISVIEGAVANLPMLVGQQVGPLIQNQLGEVNAKIEGVGSRIDTSLDSLSEGLLTIEETLSSFGLAEGEESVDIPSSIKTIVETVSGSDKTRGRDNSVPSSGLHPCRYMTCNIPAEFVCKCGCGTEVHGAPGTGQGASTVGSGMAQSFEGVHQQQSAAADPQKVKVVPSTAQSQQQAFFAAARTPLKTPMPQYSVATPPSTPVPAPLGSVPNIDLFNAPSEGKEYVADNGQSSGMTRKQRKLVRHLEYKRKAEEKKQKTSHTATYPQQYTGQGGSSHQDQRFHNYGGQLPRPGVPGGAGYRLQAPTLPNWGSGMLQNPVWNQQFRQPKPY